VVLLNCSGKVLSVTGETIAHIEGTNLSSSGSQPPRMQIRIAQSPQPPGLAVRVARKADSDQVNEISQSSKSEAVHRVPARNREFRIRNRNNSCALPVSRLKPGHGTHRRRGPRHFFGM